MDGLIGDALEPHEAVTLSIDGLPFRAPSLDKVSWPNAILIAATPPHLIQSSLLFFFTHP